jgi:ABC-type transport system involved in multi-copper enzyme maturation permease subunit
MRNPLHTPFAAVFTNEVLLNTKRVAPYVLMVLFSANAVLWWGWGPAVARGWATNSDFYIQRNFGGFTFILGLPIFTAIMVGDTIIRDLRLNVDPLIFSKPVGRGSYVLGKFLGSFFVLVCCQSAFAITLFLLQWVPFSGMITFPVRVVPYFKHFFFMVVISHLGLAALYFTAGTLARNAKVVYGMAACFYPAYFALQVALFKNLPPIFGVLFDPLGLSIPAFASNIWAQSPDYLNRLVHGYSALQYTNRASVIVITSICLFVVYRRFKTEMSTSVADDSAPVTLSLSEPSELVAYTPPTYASPAFPFEKSELRDRVVIPSVTPVRGPKATRFKIFTATGIEFQLLRAERGLLVLVPLAIILSFLSVPFGPMKVEVSYSVTSATGTVNMLLLFLSGVIVFYLGEAIHRDRELRFEPVLWSAPAPNSVLLLSKCFAMIVSALLLVVVSGLATIGAQLFRGFTPIDLPAYFLINSIVMAPSVIFIIALVLLLNVVLRNKYVAYVAAVGTGAGLIYLYNIGYNHWSYNPTLYGLWNYGNLTSWPILLSRLYCLALAAVCLALAHVLHQRKST